MINWLKPSPGALVVTHEVPLVQSVAELVVEKKHPHGPPPGTDPERNVRYTLQDDMDACMAFARVTKWDLDAAADDDVHWSEYYYTRFTNGLANPWRSRTWCNPPFDNLGAWIRKCWYEITEGNADIIGFLCPCNRTDQGFWQDLVEPFRDAGQFNYVDNPAWPVRLRSKFLRGRTRFGQPGDILGLKQGSPPFGCVTLVWERL